MNPPPCPTRDQLSAFLLGSLPEEQIDSMADHLDNCTSCQSLAQTLDGVGDTLLSDLRRSAAADSLPPLDQQCLSMISQAELLLDLPASVNGEAQPLGQLRDYRLLAKLGQGGMGTVYKALHLNLKRYVALKVLPQSRMQNSQAVARFRREMEAVGKLDHPNIVRATDAGQQGDTHYLEWNWSKGPIYLGSANKSVRYRSPKRAK